MEEFEQGQGVFRPLSVGDAEAILSEVPSVKYVAPYVYGVAQVIYESQNWSPFVAGIVPEMLEIGDWPVAFGSSFTQQDVNGGAKVCLLGMTVAGNLFEGIDPIGKIVRIKNLPFSVTGVLCRKADQAAGVIGMTR